MKIANYKDKKQQQNNILIPPCELLVLTFWIQTCQLFSESTSQTGGAITNQIASLVWTSGNVCSEPQFQRTFQIVHPPPLSVTAT